MNLLARMPSQSLAKTQSIISQRAQTTGTQHQIQQKSACLKPVTN